MYTDRITIELRSYKFTDLQVIFHSSVQSLVKSMSKCGIVINVKPE